MVYKFLTFGKMSPLVELSEKRFFPFTTLPFAVASFANLAQKSEDRFCFPFWYTGTVLFGPAVYGR